ncbi:MAG: hypothetical protein RIS76_2316 [Verrucomicrobiota bacterium]
MKPRGFIAMVLVLVIGSTAQAGGAETSTTSADSQVAAASPSPYLEWLRQQLPRPRFDAGYVGSESCRQCHGEEFGSWHRSYHRTMTQPATADSVIGRFDGSTVDCGGLPYRVFQEGEGFWAEMPDPDVLMYVVQGGRKVPLEKIPRVKRPVVMTTGSHHYQTYWVTSPRYPGLLQTLPLVFLKEGQRWIPRDAAFMRGPDDTERIVTQWNHHCIRCHSTGGNPGLDDQGQLKSAVGELGIACEACHGPGRVHMEKQQSLRQVPAALPAAPQGQDGSIVNPSRLDHRRSSEVCGQCHGAYTMRDEFAMEFARNGPLYLPGEDLSRTRNYMTHPHMGGGAAEGEDLKRNQGFYESRWWDDGTILAGGREYTAFLGTKCYTRGTMSCLSCHSMHDSDPNDQLKVGRDGPAACTQCHRETKFTTGLERHTGHAAVSSGSNCLNCHMPHSTYALFKAIRTHEIASPQVVSSARYGVPNACNLCHLDRTLAWTQEHLMKRYGHREVPLSEEQRTTSAALLWLLKGNAAQRVITAWHFGWEPAQKTSGTHWMAPFLSQSLADAYGPVRFVGARSLRTLPGYADFKYDFLAGAVQWSNAVSMAVQHWPGIPPEEAARPTVLLREGGAVDAGRLTVLLREQDRRSVTIME